MKVLFLNTPLTFECIPRIYPISTDTLRLILRDELQNSILEPKISFMVQQKLSITILEQPQEFSPQSKYEITVLRDDKTIYKGKLIVLNESTDIQNYTYGSQSTAKFKFRE